MLPSGMAPLLLATVTGSAGLRHWHAGAGTGSEPKAGLVTAPGGCSQAELSRRDGCRPRES